eukprot:SAG22_NODE_21928_length_252_cov_9.098039_1_plen_38_part_10
MLSPTYLFGNNILDCVHIVNLEILASKRFYAFLSLSLA